MSFWDNVKKFAQPYSDDDYDDYDEDDDYVDDYEEPAEAPAPAPARRERRRPAAPAPVMDEEEEESGFGFTPVPAAPAAPVATGFNGQILNMSGSGSNKQEVVLFRPGSFNDTSKAADDLRSKKAVIVNMENVDKAMARRVVDFLSGCAYALDGKVKKIAQSTYLFCPHGMNIVGDLENFQGEVESYV